MVIRYNGLCLMYVWSSAVLLCGYSMFLVPVCLIGTFLLIPSTDSDIITYVETDEVINEVMDMSNDRAWIKLG